LAAAAYSQEDVLWVRRALETLPATDRFLIRLHDFDRLTLEEIGERIGLKKSAVSVRLQRARDNLRLALRHGGKKSAIKRLQD
jgi:RNA polymerase sigma factor (sigma-70 family)